jgi:multimeric flavodoxin WrbA
VATEPVQPTPDFSGLRAVFVNCSLKRRPAESHTARLVDRSAGVMRALGVDVDVIHALEHEIPFGMATDLTEQGLDRDDWPSLHARIMAADALVIATPIWLGEPSSVASLVIERLYAHSSETNDRGQYLYYGKVGGCLVTGNEDGIKACAKRVLYSLQHIGFTVPPQADAGWIGEAGPGPSYGDAADGAPPTGFDSDFTNRNTTIATWNLLHLALMFREAGGFPAPGNQVERWRDVENAADHEPSPVS